MIIMELRMVVCDTEWSYGISNGRIDTEWSYMIPNDRM